MTTANHLINALAADNADDANAAFDALIQSKLSDNLEVRKVELASVIMDDLQEGQGMDAQRRWTRHVSAIGKAYPAGQKRSIHRDELKGAARKYFKNMGGVENGVGAEYVDQGAKFVRDARKAKVPRLQGEETNLDEVSAPGQEAWIKANKARFIARYGAKKGKEVLYAKAWKMAKEEAELNEGGPTRKHFQQTADLLKNIPDEAKRKELAQHHAGLYKAQNPRFDRAKFMAAAGVNEESVNEVLSGGSKKEVAPPSNAQLNRNVMMNIRRAVQALRVKGVNPNMAAAGHRDFSKLVAKNPKAPGYMLLRKLAPAKAQAVQSLTQAGVPLGGSLEANPQDFNQVVQRIKRFK